MARISCSCERLVLQCLNVYTWWTLCYVTCYVKVTQYYNIFCNTAGLSCQCLHVTVTHTKVYDITKRNHVFFAHKPDGVTDWPLPMPAISRVIFATNKSIVLSELLLGSIDSQEKCPYSSWMSVKRTLSISLIRKFLIDKVLGEGEGGSGGECQSLSLSLVMDAPPTTHHSNSSRGEEEM